MQTFAPLHPIRAKRLAWYIKKLKPVVYYPLNETVGSVARDNSTPKRTSYAITSITRSGSTATVTTTANHGLVTGETIEISGANQAEYNGNFKITVTGVAEFTYTVSGTPATPATGTIVWKKDIYLNGTITGATIGQDGLVGKAYSFDGTGDYISIADNDAIEGMSALTILFLLKQDTMSAFEKLFFKNSVYDIGLNNNGLIFTELVGIVNIGTWDSQPGGGIDDDTWRLVVQTYDGATFKGYLNDTVVETTGSLTGSLGTGGGALAIGRHEDNQNEYYSGLLQHLAIFNRALTQDEITKLARIVGLA